MERLGHDKLVLRLKNLQALAKRNKNGYDLEKDHIEALRDNIIRDETGSPKN